VVVGGVGLGVLAAGEDHAGDLALEQHVDVLGLRHRAGARAEDCVEPRAGKRSADDLGECRKDRVLQFGHDEPDHARAPDAEMRRALVPDHVERRQDRGPGGVRDPRLPVEHAAHRRLAHAGLFRDV